MPASKKSFLKPFERMAEYYDLIYREIMNYESDCDYLELLFKKYASGRVASILDVGCGTGNHAFILARRGYKVTGIDQSEEMLRVARRKSSRKLKNPVFYRRDMRRIDLGGRYDVAIVMFGGFGYLPDDEGVHGFLRSVRRHLTPKGLLVHEFWHVTGVDKRAETPAGYQGWIKVEDKRTGRLVIRLGASKYRSDTNLVDASFDHYIVNTKSRRILDEFRESHPIRTYSISQMNQLLRANGFTSLGFHDGDAKIGGAKPQGGGALNPASLSSFRVTAVSRPNAA